MSNPVARDLAFAAAEGYRLDADEACLLLDQADPLDLAEAADRVRSRIHPDPVVTYVIDRNINYTNVCSSRCRFCAFWREPESPEAYVLSVDQVLAKVKELVDAGGTQVLMQGGLNPTLDLDWICSLLAAIRAEFPGVDLHSLSPPEVHHFATGAGLSVEETLLALQESGLSSLPGGGAEILTGNVRGQVSPAKCTSDEWLEVMAAAHRIGLRTTATMMFGHLDRPADRAAHMVRVRGLQDSTGGFTAFIPWTFQSANTALAELPPLGAYTYLRTLAVSRLVLDNVPNIQASWVTQGAKIAQLSLRFGANDLGGTMMEENVVAAAGCRFRIDPDDLWHLATEAGFILRQRRTDYSLVPSPSFRGPIE